MPTGTDRERISSLEKGDAHQDAEIGKLREKSHRHSNIVHAYEMEELPRRVTALEAFKNRAVGMAMAVSALGGLIGGWIANRLWGE